MNNQENFYNNLLFHLGNVGLGVHFLILLACLVYWQKCSPALRYFFYYLLANLLLNLLSLLWVWSVNKYYLTFWKPILDYLKIDNNSFFDGIIYLTNIILLGTFYQKILSQYQKAKWLNKLIVMAAAFQIFNYFFIDGFRTQGRIGPILDGLYFIILSGLYMWQVSNNPPNVAIRNNSYFLISLSFFVSYLVLFILFFVRNTINESNFVLFCKIQIWNIAISIVAQLSYFYAFSKARYVKYL